MAWERGRRDRAGDKGKEEEVCGGRGGKVVRLQKDLSERAEKTWMRRLSGQPAWEQEPPVKKQ